MNYICNKINNKNDQYVEQANTFRVVDRKNKMQRSNKIK